MYAIAYMYEMNADETTEILGNVWVVIAQLQWQRKPNDSEL